jgi:mRNA interferase MazF
MDSDNKIFTGVCKKGEIWNIEQGDSKPTGTEIWANRPAIIVSNNGTNQKAGFVNVVYLTTAEKKPMPYHVNVMSGGKSAIALCEQIFAVDKSRIGFYVGEVTSEEMLEIDKALLISLGISNSLKPNTLFDKWLNSIDRYKVDLSGNPCLSDEDKSKQALEEEVLMWKNLYEKERAVVDQIIRKQ